MVKYFFIIVLMVSGLSSVSQEQERKSVEGKITIPGEYSAEGITVFNLTSGAGTISDENGEFRIMVAVGDQLRFTSLLFEQFTIQIEEGVYNSGELNLYLNAAVTELPEVVVSPNKLTGYVYVDVARLEVNEPEVPRYDPEDLRVSEYSYSPDSLTGAGRNDAMAASRTRLVNGLNFVNLFKAFIADSDLKKREKEKLPNREIDEIVRRIYDDEFFREYMDIKLENVSDFIFYASDHGLTENMLRKGNELDLIAFLIDQSKNYKKLRTDN